MQHLPFNGYQDKLPEKLLKTEDEDSESSTEEAAESMTSQPINWVKTSPKLSSLPESNSIPVLDELHSSDSNSSTDGDRDYLIPDLDLLDVDSSALQRPNVKNEDTDDRQILQRRDRNRKAAYACRKRQKEKTEKLEEMLQKLKSEEDRYLKQIQRTKEQIAKYQTLFKQHLPRCRLMARAIQKQKIAMNQRKQRTAVTMAHRQRTETFLKPNPVNRS